MTTTTTADTAATLAAALESTVPLLMRYVDDITEDERATQVAGIKNHPAWILGHLTLTLHLAMERLTGHETEPPVDPGAFGYGSKPVAEKGGYPAIEDLRDRFARTMTALAGTLRSGGEALLERSVNWGGDTITGRDLVARMIFHNGTHTGQLIQWRHALEKPLVVG